MRVLAGRASVSATEVAARRPPHVPCRRPLLTRCAATAVVVVATAAAGFVGRAWIVSDVNGRRAALRHAALLPVVAAALGEQAPARAVIVNGKEIPPGYVPAEVSAEGLKVGEKVVTPNGLEYTKVQEGTSGKSPRDGPPRSGTRAWVRFTGHVDGPDGPIFDASVFRGKRMASQNDYVEITLNREPTITNGMNEALKLMKVGEKGRFVQPPLLSYGEGTRSFEGDEAGEVKGQIDGNSTLYYDIELVSIIKP